jgi:hypothetical protein
VLLGKSALEVVEHRTPTRPQYRHVTSVCVIDMATFQEAPLAREKAYYVGRPWKSRLGDSISIIR